MQRAIIGSMVCILALVTAGCASLLFDAPQAQIPISMSSKIGVDYQMVRHFAYESRAIWLISPGLLALRAPDIGEIVQRESAGGNAVANLKIKKQYTVLDWLIEVATLGIIHTETIFIEGDVVKTK